ncbi:hypothetical protein ACE1B6_24050 [Aerosakkonemataceae cyanobacterium BLCC-F154]|uniref:Uncharacterized protein n=1 Tax=Floridaenema fluviatile BLCC-F154 TaxID=3153640 RepID=A0ABV4YHM6_9CYAN
MTTATANQQSKTAIKHRYVLVNNKMGAYQVFEEGQIRFDSLDLDRMHQYGYFKWADEHTYWCLACVIN